MNPVISDFKTDRNGQFNLKFMNMAFSASQIQEALALYHIGCFNGLCPSQAIISQSENNPFLHHINNSLNLSMSLSPDIEKYAQYMMAINQKGYQVSAWSKCKQTFVFDKDFAAELDNTDGNFNIPHNVFKYLPYSTFYMDFSANKELCDKLGADGTLVTVINAAVVNADIHNKQDDWVILTSNYKENMHVYNDGYVISTDDENGKVTIDNIVDKANTVTQILPDKTGYDVRNMIKLTTQSLLYLSSVEPDIHEKEASKQQFRQAKMNKKSSKTNMPERTYNVGERFGEAFHKWTEGSLGSNNKSEPSDRRVRPHIRKAHWHRFWVGKHDSPERRLTIKWVSETFCGVKEQEAEKRLDVVKHNTRNNAVTKDTLQREDDTKLYLQEQVTVLNKCNKVDRLTYSVLDNGTNESHYIQAFYNNDEIGFADVDSGKITIGDKSMAANASSPQEIIKLFDEKASDYALFTLGADCKDDVAPALNGNLDNSRIKTTNKSTQDYDKR